MDTAALKKEITNKINQILSPEILQELDQIVDDLITADHSGKDFWNELPESVKENIKKSQKEIVEGKTIPHHEVMKEIRQWLKRSDGQ